MSKELRVLSKLGTGEEKYLLLELPQDLASGLGIQADGQVSTHDLLNLFSAVLCQEQGCQLNSQDLISLQERIELMLNIYDSDRAID